MSARVAWATSVPSNGLYEAMECIAGYVANEGEYTRVDIMHGFTHCERNINIDCKIFNT